MKKTLYTIAFLSFFAIAGNAQSTDNSAKKNNDAKAVKVNPDGTAASELNNTDVKSDKPAPAAQNPGNGGTRMAITEKGMPAAKSKNTKDSKDAKGAKNTEGAK